MIKLKKCMDIIEVDNGFHTPSNRSKEMKVLPDFPIIPYRYREVSKLLSINNSREFLRAEQAAATHC